MPIVADVYSYVVGVDTHAKTHTYAIIACPNGHQVTMTRQFPTTPAGLQRALRWITTHTSQASEVLCAVECTSTYGAGITQALTAASYRVVQAIAPTKKTRRYHGKSDDIDAAHAATALLGRDPERLVEVKDTTGHLAAMTLLLGARDRLNTRRTGDIQALTALLRATPALGVDARKPPSAAVITKIATTWTPKPTSTDLLDAARTHAHTLASAIIAYTQDLAANKSLLTTLAKTTCPSLLDQPGVGPISACTILAARSGTRLRDEAAFARLAGVAPIPASSGNTQRHRYTRSGDRRLNRAIATIVTSRLRYDPDTKAYLNKRTTTGTTPRETARILRRYTARQLHRHLNPLGY